MVLVAESPVSAIWTVITIASEFIALDASVPAIAASASILTPSAPIAADVETLTSGMSISMPRILSVPIPPCDETPVRFTIGELSTPQVPELQVSLPQPIATYASLGRRLSG
jgi:hypothetical protein